MQIGRETLSHWNSEYYQIKVGDKVVEFEHLAIEMLQLFDARTINEETLVKSLGWSSAYGPTEGWKKLSETNLFKSFPRLRQLTATRLNMLMLEELEKFRIRFLWWSVGMGLMLGTFFLFGVKVWVSGR